MNINSLKIVLGKKNSVLSENRGWVKIKYTNVFKSGGNMLGKNNSKC